MGVVPRPPGVEELYDLARAPIPPTADDAATPAVRLVYPTRLPPDRMAVLTWVAHDRLKPVQLDNLSSLWDV